MAEAADEKKSEGSAGDAKAADKAAARKRRGRKNIAEGVVHIHSTFNNTIVTISDYQGERRRDGVQRLTQRHAVRRSTGRR